MVISLLPRFAYTLKLQNISIINILFDFSSVVALLRNFRIFRVRARARLFFAEKLGFFFRPF
jgi:hypothetical protein